MKEMRIVVAAKQFFSSKRVAPILGALLVLGIAPGVAPGVALAADPSGLIDFGGLADQVQPILTAAITAAAGVGVLVLAAVICWKFFRRFLQG